MSYLAIMGRMTEILGIGAWGAWRIPLGIGMMLLSVPLFVVARRCLTQGELDRLQRNEEDPPTMSNPYDTDSPAPLEGLGMLVGVIAALLLAGGVGVLIEG